jgi:hypothetical protein
MLRKLRSRNGVGVGVNDFSIFRDYAIYAELENCETSRLPVKSGASHPYFSC